MPSLPYDASKAALFTPETSDSAFLRLAPGAPRPATIPLAVEAARLAYLRTEESESQRARLTEALQRVGLQSLRTFDHPGTDGQGFGAVLDGLVLLAFRGTQADRITDLATDIDTLLRPWELLEGKVHRGFGRSAQGLWFDDVKPWLESLETKALPLIVCGHSLGAAIATLLSAPAHRLLGATETELVTIGSPRVGNRDFVDALQKTVRITRIVNCCDLVTQVPPPPFFAHAGEPPLYLGRDGRIDAAYDADAEGRSQARQAYLLQEAWRMGTVPVRDLADHAPANYIRAFWP